MICAIRDLTAWNRARRQSRLVIRAAERERAHLSRELHDDLLQSLTAFKIRTRLLADERDDGERERARKVLAAGLADAISRLRRLVRGLLPPELKRQGLNAALRSACGEIEDVYGFAVHVSGGRAADGMDGAAALALYRVLHEAVMNAARHSGANEATVTIKAACGTVVATVRDDGRGFELQRLESSAADDCIGLAGMRERAELAGGRVEIRTSRGDGTTIRVVVPTGERERETDCGR